MRQAEEQKKARGGNRDDKRDNKNRGYSPNKEEVHALVQFAKNAMKQSSNEDLKKFENLLVSDEESK